MAKHLTIVSDLKFLTIGVTSVRSLIETSSIPIVIHYYCSDVESFYALSTLQLGTDNVKVIPYHPSSIFCGFNTEMENALKNLKETKTYYFFWTLASYFSNFVMHHTECDSVLYVDSDIVFHKDVKILFDIFQEKDCGIFKHRFMEEIGDPSNSGKYNVGVVYFKNSNKGKDLLSWWADAVVFQKYPEYAKCGDQMYLEYFPKVCDSSQLYIDDHIGHGAPWDWAVYDVSEISKGYVSWKGERMPHVFSHFSKFVYNFQSNTFECSNPGLYDFANKNGIAFKNPAIYSIHKNYFEEMKNSYRLIVSKVPGINLPTSSNLPKKEKKKRFIWSLSK